MKKSVVVFLGLAIAISPSLGGFPVSATTAPAYAHSAESPQGDSENVSITLPKVSEFIVQYGDSTPLWLRNGLPWGAQCLKKKHQDRLRVDRALGSSMWVLRIKPPAGPKVATLILNRMNNCSGVDWAEIALVGLEPAGN